MSYVEQPPLSHWGIEEIERGTCEDTLENRRKLSMAKVPWQISEPGIIEVMFTSEDELNKYHGSVHERKKLILTKPSDPWSDYLPMDELPLDYWETAPAWVIRHWHKYNDALAEGVSEEKMPLPLTRCKRLRADGSRCWGWAWPAKRAEGFCKGHSKFGAFNAMEQSSMLTQAARARLGQLNGPALDALEDLVINSTVPHVRLKAATEILDRNGIRGGSDITISGQIEHTTADPAQVIRDKLATLASRITPKELEESSNENTDIIEGEVVENDPRSET